MANTEVHHSHIDDDYSYFAPSLSMTSNTTQLISVNAAVQLSFKLTSSNYQSW
ncbi:hypothetical protein TorRG33x02_212300 [Trema orientale]|uniref:Uncharacterized protein n=1 Tax=Trema orientale TaxID=63057 RepID=A0A2P5EBP3_TREOI|nr:hypothetical protein TorRG33x02_212300 [Trema orientale]